MKYVRETKAGSEISAYVVLNRKNRQVATVQIHHAATVRVDVFAVGDGPLARNCDAMGFTRPKDEPRRAGLNEPDPQWYAAICQHGKASGGGYDKETAALSGLFIDGRRIFDHCGHDASLERLYARYRREIANVYGPARDQVQARFDRLAKKRGATFANPQSVDTKTNRNVRTVELSLFDENDRETKGYNPKDRLGTAYGETPKDYELIECEYADRYCRKVYGSLFYEHGLKRFEALGYRVIRAI